MLIALLMCAVLLTAFIFFFDRKNFTEAGSIYAKDWKGIISPLFGNPVLLNKSDSNKSFYLFVVTANPPHPEQCSVTLQFGRRRFPLIITEIKHLSAEDIKSEFNEWTAENSGPVYRCKCVIPNEFTLPVRVPALLDFVSGTEQYTSVNSVFALDKPAEKFLFASDIHLARFWDELEQKFTQYITRNGGREIVNPNRNFELLLEFANGLFASGEIDALVLGGDIVEYKFSSGADDKTNADATTNADDTTNWELFWELLNDEEGTPRCKFPVFTLTGNHDYRLYPYEPVVTGLTHLGAEPHTARSFFREHYRVNGFVALVKAFRSLQRSTGKDHSLDRYYRTVNAYDVFSVVTGGLTIVFASSGSDAICTPVSFGRIKNLPGILNAAAPQSVGFQASSINRITDLIQSVPSSEQIVFFSHAPLWNNAGYKKMFASPLLNAVSVSYYDTESLPGSLKHTGGTILFGGEELTGLLSRMNKPAVYISGHTHYPAIYAKTNALRGLGYAPIPLNEECEAELEPGNPVNIHSGSSGFYSNELNGKPASVLILDFSTCGKCVFSSVSLPKLH